jgi:prolyl oligopeptidase
VAHAVTPTVAWLPDSSGFFCTAEPAGADPGWQRIHRVDMRTLSAKLEAVELDVPQVGPLVAADGRRVMAVTGHTSAVPSYLCDLGTGEWVPFLRRAEGSYPGVLLADAYVCVTTEGAARGRVVAIPLSTPDDRSTWTTLLSESQDVLRHLSRADGRLVVSCLNDAVPTLLVLQEDGAVVQRIEHPSPGAMGPDASGATLPSAPLATISRDDVVYVHSSPAVSPSVHRVSLSSPEREELVEAHVAIAGATTTMQRAISRDGTLIPFSVTAIGDPAEGQRPTLLTAYGGFNIVVFPHFEASVVPFLRAGGVHVRAHIRGGGEYGDPWWHSGRLEQKQNSYEDLYAVAEHLIEHGITTAQQLGFVGGSNGGLMGCVAATQRPELFRAVVARIPITDMLGFHRDPITRNICVPEYGDPDGPAAQWLRGYSPCHNVVPGTTYPATLLCAGENDVRTPAWHARKLAYLLQQGNGGRQPVELLVWPDAGHGAAAAAADAVTHDAEWLSFLMEQLGMQSTHASSQRARAGEPVGGDGPP